MMTLACAEESKEQLSVVVKVKNRAAIDAKQLGNVSPALMAVRDSGGTLRGVDVVGQPVIAVSTAQAEALARSPAVESIKPTGPTDPVPVDRLKLTYSPTTRPAPDFLKANGLTILEDYQKGGFMIVQVNGRPLDAKLIAEMSKDPAIQYLTVVAPAKAIQTQQSP